MRFGKPVKIRQVIYISNPWENSASFIYIYIYVYVWPCQKFGKWDGFGKFFWRHCNLFYARYLRGLTWNHMSCHVPRGTQLALRTIAIMIHGATGSARGQCDWTGRCIQWADQKQRPSPKATYGDVSGRASPRQLGSVCSSFQLPSKN